jgi:hypothetical protein
MGTQLSRIQLIPVEICIFFCAVRYALYIRKMFRFISSLLLIPLVLSGMGRVCNAQQLMGQGVFLSPGITAGYTIGAGCNLGFALETGIRERKAVNPFKYGMSFSWGIVNTKRYVHRLRTTDLLVKNDYVDMKLGIGRVKNKWGYSGHNRCVTHGLSMDISFAYPSPYSPWIGFKTFRYKYSSWAWFFRPYNSFYTRIDYDLLRVPNIQRMKQIGNNGK